MYMCVVPYHFIYNIKKYHKNTTMYYEQGN